MILSRCFKNYDVKLFRHGGCVPATHEGVEDVNPRDVLRCSLRSASHT
jgi:hypothetical protein